MCGYTCAFCNTCLFLFLSPLFIENVGQSIRHICLVCCMVGGTAPSNQQTQDISFTFNAHLHRHEKTVACQLWERTSQSRSRRLSGFLSTVALNCVLILLGSGQSHAEYNLFYCNYINNEWIMN